MKKVLLIILTLFLITGCSFKDLFIKENKNKWLLKVANKAITYTKTEKNINIFLFCTIASRILLNKFLDLIALCLQI